jgi:hypothetical protein
MPAEAHQALNSQLPENLKMNENVEAFENLSPTMSALANGQ